MVISILGLSVEVFLLTFDSSNSWIKSYCCRVLAKNVVWKPGKNLLCECSASGHCAMKAAISMRRTMSDKLFANLVKDCTWRLNKLVVRFAIVFGENVPFDLWLQSFGYKKISFVHCPLITYGLTLSYYLHLYKNTYLSEFYFVQFFITCDFFVNLIQF